MSLSTDTHQVPSISFLYTHQSQTMAKLTPSFLFLLLTATLGPLLFGYHLAELNAPQEVITCAKKSIKSTSALERLKAEFKEHVYNGGEKVTTLATGEDDEYPTALPQCIEMDATQLGVVSSMFTLGGLIGALAAGPITAKAGRVRTMLLSAIAATLGPVFEAAAPNIGTMALGRFIAGLGAGMAMVVVPIYIFDIAPPGQKGFFGTFTQVMVNMGILATQVLGYFLSRGQMWRVILGVGGLIALVQAVCLGLGGQESPKYMAEHGMAGRAKKVLRRIRGEEADIEEEVASWGATSQGLEDEEETLLANDGARDSTEDRPTSDPNSSPLKRTPSKTNERETLGPFAVLAHPHTRPAVLTVAMVMLAQQLTGINSIVMYGVALLSDLLAANSALLNVAVSALNVLITAAAAPLIERLGRKTCLLMSISGMGISSALLAVGIQRAIPILSALAVLTFVSSFGLGLGPVPFILASELVGPEAVGATQSWALAANWIATFVVAQFFPMVNAALGKGQVYFIFLGCAIFFGAFVLLYLPETKGKRDADEVWGRGKGRED